MPESTHTRVKITGSSRYSIEVNESAVRVIRTSAAGQIVKAASVNLPKMPEKFDAAYVKALANTIRKAARAARADRGVGIPCAMVTGGPHVIIRRFLWPEMNKSALQANALTEIAPYLPGDPGSFTVNHQVIHAQKRETGGIMLDILVAAIPTEIALAVTAAARKAGFAPSRLDVRENARGKLVMLSRSSPEAEDPPSSYAILDIGSSRLNMALYLNGFFYSNRYFSSLGGPDESQDVTEEDAALAAIMAGESFSASSPAVPDTRKNYDTDALANEIASIIDYIQYRERGSRIDCILLMGSLENMPGIVQSLESNLEIPIYETDEWVDEKLLSPKLKPATSDISVYLDAYGAAFSEASNMDLRPARKKSAARQLLLPAVCTLAVLAALIYAGIVIPYGAKSRLESEEAKLTAELAGFPVSIIELERISREVNTINALIQDVELFFSEYPQAKEILNTVFIYSGLTINSLSVSNGQASVSGQSRDFNKLAESLEFFREHELFETADAQSANSTTQESLTGVTDFSGTLKLKSGAGTR